MDDAVICARCAAELTPGEGTFYMVTIDAVADPSGPNVPEEVPSTEQIRREIDALMRQLHDTSPREAMDQVHRRLTLHLCVRCYRGWIENPAGA